MSIESHNSTERSPLALSQQLVGKQCWRVNFGYAGELNLHCGARIPYDSPKMAGKTRGAWRLGVAGTQWKLITPVGEMRSKGSRESALLKSVKLLEGVKIKSLSVTGKILSVEFNNGCVLQVIPEAADDSYDLPYWEIFMPRGKMVSFGPKRAWHVGTSKGRKQTSTSVRVPKLLRR